MKSFKFNTRQTLVLLGATVFTIVAGAQTVYRCGSSYSQTPCNGGTEVSVDDARTDAQRDAAQDGLARDKALGKEMETSRRKDEAQALARDNAALAAQAKLVAKEKAERRKIESKRNATDRKPHSKGKDKDREVFTVTIGGGKHPSKSK